MGIFRRVWALGRRSSVGNENDRELREQMQMRVDTNIAKGMSLEQVAREARLRFGNPGVMRERVDAEDAALGIGANTALFPLLDAARLLSLPIQAPQELAELRIAGGNPSELGVTNGPYARFTIPMWLEVRHNHEPFSGVFAWCDTG
jgi:hypothetical protein